MSRKGGDQNDRSLRSLEEVQPNGNYQIQKLSLAHLMIKCIRKCQL